MKISSQRVLATTVTATAVAIVVAFIVRTAKHGFALYLGDAAWITFLIGALVTVVLVCARLANVARDRRSTRPAAR